MRPSYMRLMQMLLLWLALVAANAGCDGTQTSGLGGPLDTRAELGDGPCYDANGTLTTETAVYVDGVAASLGHAAYSYCPSSGVDRSGWAVDGFFHTLEEAVVETEPQGTVLVSAPGYRGASLTASWRIANTEETQPAQPAAVSDGEWRISVPGREAAYILKLSLIWSTGDASYAATALVGSAGTGYSSLVVVSPVGDPAIHPTLLPEAFVACEPGEAVLRFCDPAADHAWLEIGIKPLLDLARGTSLSWDDGLIHGVFTSSNVDADDWAAPMEDQTAVTVNSSGLGDEVIDIVRSIPVFDPQYRAGVCSATPPVAMRGVTAMCDLEITGSGRLVEEDVLRLDAALGDAAVLYRYEPVVAGTTAGWQSVLVDPGDDLDELLGRWRVDMIDAAEELGFDPEATDSGSYEVRGLMIRPLPRLTQQEWEAVLSRVGEAGFGLEMQLRFEDWNGLL